MAEKVLRRWITANEHMDPEYREALVQTALSYRGQASSDLRKMANSALSSITVPGFRSFQKVPISVAIPYVVKQFQKRREVTTAIISLWSEANQQIIADVKSAASAQGLMFREPWTWREAQQGYYTFEDIQELGKVIDPLAQAKEKREHDHWTLAELWLSAALIDPAEATADEMEGATQHTELSGESHSDDGNVDTNGSGRNNVIQSNEAEKTNETQASEVIQGVPAAEIYQPDVWDSMALADLLVEGEKVQKQVDTSTGDLLDITKNIQQAVSNKDLSSAQPILEFLPTHFSTWKNDLEKEESLANYSVYRLQREFSSRMDMEHFKYIEQPGLTNLKSGFEAVLEYDNSKKAALAELEQLQGQYASLEKEWHEWQDSSALFDSNTPHYNTADPSDLTLNSLKELLHQYRNQIERLKNQTRQAHDAAINHIHRLIEKLSEFSRNNSEITIDGKNLDQIEHNDFSIYDVLQIRRLEASLQEELDHQILKKPGEVADLSSALINEWNNQEFLKLLSSLDGAHRDGDVFLALMAAALGREKPEPITLAPEIFTSLQNGIAAFSGSKPPSDLIGRVLQVLVNGYFLEDKNSIAELCILSLAVTYSASYQLPEGLLWQITKEWPVDTMHGWNKLWQSALLGTDCPIYSDHKQIELREKLAESRARADKDFARDGAHYIRVGSLPSFRHLTLMTQLLQKLEEKLDILKEQDRVLAITQPDQLQKAVKHLSDLLQDNIFSYLDEEKLNEMYAVKIRSEKIDDSNPFHQRTSLKLLKECAHSIRDYGESLLELWDLSTKRIAGLDSQTILSELDYLPSISNLCRTAAQQMVLSPNQTKKTWDEVSFMEEFKDQLTFELLTQPNFTLRLPRLIGYIVENAFQWNEIFHHLLQDLAEPLEAVDIAQYLLSHHAPNQVLGLVQFIPLDMQTQAQISRRENELFCDQLTLDYLNLGGKSDDLRQMREIGRWGCLTGELRKRIEILRTAAEANAREIENQSRDYRKKIQELDDAIFDVRTQIPSDVHDVIQHGLALARRAYSNKDMFSSIEEYLQELNYRLSHNSWSLISLQQATERFEKSLTDTQSAHNSNVKAERVLELLESSEFATLGLSKIDSSEVNTRINLLSNWIKIKDVHSLYGKDLLQTELSAIQYIFSYFARMMSMTRFHTQNGKSLDSIDPLVVEYWEMRYPRTNALDNQYVLITLPGDPPSMADLQTIESFIEDKELLDYYFVLLFVPGCSEKIHRRLQRKGLVVIDETRLLEMVLAEANDNNPLGVLRPMVLNAIEANANIFIANQSVNARTAIFVGRDNLIDGIVNSGESYAIYGGRRIGKSSVLKAVEQRLIRRGYKVAPLSLEGEKDFSDDYISKRVAQTTGIEDLLEETGSLKQALLDYMESNPDHKLAILLDEIDRYIVVNSQRHTMVEAFRTCSDRFENRFRVIVAGFMDLYYCLHGRGHSPYSPNSDPWRRMFTNNRELENLTPISAEEIVRQGFVSILGWKFDHWAIPQRIVERTGGHPAFVQVFCLKLLERIRARKDQTIRLNDIEEVFNDPDPRNSFIAFVRDTLNLNLEPVSNYLIIWLAADTGDASGFTMDKIRDIAQMSKVTIPEDCLRRSLDLLKVTSVIRERMTDIFDFTVPDYPSILNRLGNTSHMDELEENLKQVLK